MPKILEAVTNEVEARVYDRIGVVHHFLGHWKYELKVCEICPVDVAANLFHDSKIVQFHACKTLKFIPVVLGEVLLDLRKLIRVLCDILKITISRAVSFVDAKH